MDKSGSMMNMGVEAIDGINNFYDEQKKTGDFDSTLVFFNDKVTFVYENMPSDKIEKITEKEYQPSGMTALYDSIGKSIEKQKTIKTDNVIFVVLTDGLDNSSQEYDKYTIKTLIKKMETDHNWKFIYLGANQDSYTVGGGMGFKHTVDYDATPLGCNTVMRSLSDTVSRCITENLK